MTDAEIAGYMDWRGPGAYTERQLRRIRSIVEEVQRREREKRGQAMQVRPSEFVQLVKGQATLTGFPAYWAEWPNREQP